MGGLCVPRAEACSPAGFPLLKCKELMCPMSLWQPCSGPCQIPELVQPSATTAGSPGAPVILPVLSSHLHHRAGAWASRTLVPTEGMALMQSPSRCGSCPTPTGAIAAPARPAAGHPRSQLAHPRAPQPMPCVGRHVLPCCAQALPSLRGPWLPAVLALPWIQSIASEGWWPEQEGLFETPVTLGLFTLQGILLLAWLTCVGLSPLQCPPAVGP